MEPLVVNRRITIPAEYLAVSYTRDLGGDGTPEKARDTPTTVELRFEIGRFEGLPEAARAWLLERAGQGRGSRATVRVVCSDHHTKGKNLAEARHRLVMLIRDALRGESLPPPAAPAKRHAGRAGLIKVRRTKGRG